MKQIFWNGRYMNLWEFEKYMIIKYQYSLLLWSYVIYVVLKVLGVDLNVIFY